MNAVMKRLVVRPLRYAVRLVLQRPWLKKRAREMVTRMPRLHGLVMGVMFQAPGSGQPRISGELKDLSPNGRHAHRLLKQAIRTRRR
jgi:hypothetical protein